MILSRQAFEYDNQILLEKVVIQLPYRYEAIFQNEGCFLYIQHAASKFHAASGTTPVHPKEAVLLKCGTYFIDFIKHIEAETVEVIAFHLFPEVLKKLYQKEFPETLQKQLSGEKSVERIIPNTVLEKFIENLSFYFSNRSLVNDDIIELKIKELILLLIQSNYAESVKQLFTDLFSPRNASIKAVVEAHLFSNLTIDEMAKLCNLSLSSFKREFEKIYKDSPNNYVINQRIQKAAGLLKTTALNITEIAFETGFNDPSYFTRIFKKKMNTSPSNYREENQVT